MNRTENAQLLNDLLAQLERKGDIKDFIGYKDFMSHGYSIYDPLLYIQIAEFKRLDYEKAKKALLAKLQENE